MTPRLPGPVLSLLGVSALIFVFGATAYVAVPLERERDRALRCSQATATISCDDVVRFYHENGWQLVVVRDGTVLLLDHRSTDGYLNMPPAERTWFLPPLSPSDLASGDVRTKIAGPPRQRPYTLEVAFGSDIVYRASISADDPLVRSR